jgi:hypothetical protein
MYLKNVIVLLRGDTGEVDYGGLVRKTGLIMLFIGFIWLLTLQASVLLSGTRPALRTTLTKIDSQLNMSYSKKEVEDLLNEAAGAQYEATPVFLLPGTLMLAGGILGALARFSPRQGFPARSADA